MSCCICYNRSMQKTPCKHNICFACVYNLVNKDNKERIINLFKITHTNSDKIEDKIKLIRLWENKGVDNFVFNCPYCRQVVTDPKYLKKVIKEYINITVDYYINKHQFTKDFIYGYVVNHQTVKYFKVVEDLEEGEEVTIIELLLDMYKVRTDVNCGNIYQQYLVRKDKTIGDPIIINKKDVEPDYNMHKNNYFKREDEYINNDYWISQTYELIQKTY